MWVSMAISRGCDAGKQRVRDLHKPQSEFTEMNMFLFCGGTSSWSPGTSLSVGGFEIYIGHPSENQHLWVSISGYMFSPLCCCEFPNKFERARKRQGKISAALTWAVDMHLWSTGLSNTVCKPEAADFCLCVSNYHSQILYFVFLLCVW